MDKILGIKCEIFSLFILLKHVSVESELSFLISQLLMVLSPGKMDRAVSYTDVIITEEGNPRAICGKKLKTAPESKPQLEMSPCSLTEETSFKHDRNLQMFTQLPSGYSQLVPNNLPCGTPLGVAFLLLWRLKGQPCLLAAL